MSVNIPIGYVIYQTYYQYGFVMLQDTTTGERVLYSALKNSIVLYNVTSFVNSCSSSYVGCYSGWFVDWLNKTYIFNSLGQNIYEINGENSFHVNYESFNSITDMVSIQIYEYNTGNSKTISYSPSSGQVTPGKDYYDIGDTIGEYKGEIDCKQYNHPNIKLSFNGKKCDVFENDVIVKHIDLPYKYTDSFSSTIGSTICDDTIIFSYNTEMTEDSENYDYCFREQKYKQEITLINYLTGEVTQPKFDFAINHFSVIKDENGYKTLGLATISNINGDKTLYPESETYIVDTKMTFYDDVTYLNFSNLKIGSYNNKTYFVDTSTKLVYDSNLNIWKDFRDSLDSFKLSSEGKYIIGSKNNKYGVVDLSGKVVCPFKYTSISFDPDKANKLLCVRDDKYYDVSIQKSTMYYESESAYLSVQNLSIGYMLVKGTNGTTYYLLNDYGNVAYTFNTYDGSLYSSATLNCSAICKYYLAYSYTTYSTYTSYEQLTVFLEFTVSSNIIY